jgi:hypothetical protein
MRLGQKLSAKLIASTFRMLPFRVAVLVSKQLLSAQGFGVSGSKASAPFFSMWGGHSERSVLRFELTANHVDVLRQNLGVVQTCISYQCACKLGTLSLYKDSNISGLASLSQCRLEHFDIKMDKVEMEVSAQNAYGATISGSDGHTGSVSFQWEVTSALPAAL